MRSEAEAGAVPHVHVDDDALHLIDLALNEDRGTGDVTTKWTVTARARAEARIVAKARGVIAGLEVARAVFVRIDPRAELAPAVRDGDRVALGDVVCTIEGPARAVLTGERVALNFLQRLSGIATMTRAYVDEVQGTGARILDTRKTTPGWRTLEKAAVRAGGGANHRAGLYDMVLLKENHIAMAGGIAAALDMVADQNRKGVPVEIEVRNLDELEQAFHAGAERVLLDNMTLDEMRAAVQRARRAKRPPRLEASGNMTLDRVRSVAETGVDDISVGALTHSAVALDLSMQVHAL
ncbi:MAG TPA: carboxylating nicotinate-nucleotide diphosphorylase [Longimicrobiales bacterium]|nr:carboxylating nicotinate-nucleotide diphosphorylase [Longimicrobiales bacterium]